MAGRLCRQISEDLKKSTAQMWTQEWELILGLSHGKNLGFFAYIWVFLHKLVKTNITQFLRIKLRATYKNLFVGFFLGLTTSSKRCPKENWWLSLDGTIDYERIGPLLINLPGKQYGMKHATRTQWTMTLPYISHNINKKVHSISLSSKYKY